MLWIGYLQWHFRTQGSGLPPSPILRDFKNIECRDAVLTADAIAFAIDDSGKPLTRWDGRSTKPHPVTGERVPDEAAQIPLERYTHPRPATWPQADYIVGNPPFIGAATMRRALGDGYVDAVRGTWKAVPDSADFVMYWWHIAGEAVRAGQARRFGFITTNSLRQTFNRRVVQAQLEAKPPLSLAFAIPDHPWVDAADGAAVRIAMTVGAAGEGEGCLLSVRDECETDGDERNGKHHCTPKPDELALTGFLAQERLVDVLRQRAGTHEQLRRQGAHDRREHRRQQHAGLFHACRRHAGGQPQGTAESAVRREQPQRQVVDSGSW